MKQKYNKNLSQVNLKSTPRYSWSFWSWIPLLQAHSTVRITGGGSV